MKNGQNKEKTNFRVPCCLWEKTRDKNTLPRKNAVKNGEIYQPQKANEHMGDP